MTATHGEKISMLTNKLSKRKKSAIRYMEQRVMSRLSDYFSCWKLKVLLSKGQSIGQIPQNSYLLDRSSCSLDYSIWRNFLEKESSFTVGENP